MTSVDPLPPTTHPDKPLVVEVACRPVGWLCLLGLVLGAFVFKPEGNGWNLCMFQHTTGIPCPGCGLTRSVTCLLQGHADWAWHYHPLGPVAAVLMGALALLSLLPSRPYAWCLSVLSRWRGVVGATLLLVALGTMSYGIARAWWVVRREPDYAWWIERRPPPFLKKGETR